MSAPKKITMDSDRPRLISRLVAQPRVAARLIAPLDALPGFGGGHLYENTKNYGLHSSAILAWRTLSSSLKEEPWMTRVNWAR
jgi:hypothetical protein